MEEQFYIQRVPSGFLGNAVIWWGKDDEGYTAYIQNAKRFGYSEAKRVVGSGDKYRMFSCEKINRRLHAVFDEQDLRRIDEDPTGQPNPWGAGRKYITYPVEAKSSAPPLSTA